MTCSIGVIAFWSSVWTIGRPCVVGPFKVRVLIVAVSTQTRLKVASAMSCKQKQDQVNVTVFVRVPQVSPFLWKICIVWPLLELLLFTAIER